MLSTDSLVTHQNKLESNQINGYSKNGGWTTDVYKETYTQEAINTALYQFSQSIVVNFFQ